MKLYEKVSPIANLPREKAALRGVQSLSDTELLALLIGSGCRDYPVLQLAEKAKNILDGAEEASCADAAGPVSRAWETPLRTWSASKTQDALMAIPGLGKAKSLQLSAALELGRRRWSPGETAIRSPEDCWRLIRHLGDRQQEQFLVLCLNAAHVLIRRVTVTLGLLNRALVHPREVFRPAIELSSASIIVAHNHPSGNLDPSPEDIEVTSRLRDAGEILGISLLDHLVFDSNGWTSLRERGVFGG